MLSKLFNLRTPPSAETAPVQSSEEKQVPSGSGGSNPDVASIRDAGEFDLQHYRQQAGRQLSLDEAIEHYVREGERRHLSPHPGFDPAFYRSTNPDVEQAGVNGYAHYLRSGRSERRYASQAALSADALKALKSGLFDSGYFRQTYAAVDYSLRPPVEHYLLHGWREGKNASAAFDTKFYSSAFPDVRESALVPLIHYLEIGAGENRRTCADQIKGDVEIIESSGSLDVEFYRTANRLDAAELENLTPAQHYVVDGARRWLDPSPAFSTEYYLRRYPDLNQPRLNPLVHYVRFGKPEGRLAAKPGWRAVFKDAKGACLPTRPTLMVLLHECSQTGAPLLGLALIQDLAQRYNLVVWAGRAGALADDLESAAFLVGYNFPNPLDSEFVLRDLVANYPLEGVIANSVETSPIHRAILACDIPSVGLVHEFATYTLPVGRLSATLSRLDRCIVPAELIRQSALREIESIWGGSAENIVVQPQGHLPAALWSSKFAAKGEDDHEAQRQLAARLKGQKVVLGAGFFHIRKGVDLFLEVARKVREMRPGESVHFLWIGDGYAPTTDLVYSVWLQDQMEKWGLDETVTFMPGQKSIDWAFDLADVFLLSSRLDPFPNVVVDALAANVPVVCFDETTGAAEFMRASGAPGAVVPYLDTRAAAAAILDQIARGHHQNDGARIVETQLSMAAYVRVIERELVVAKALVAERRQYCEEIDRAGCFDRAFYHGEWQNFPDGRAAIREYVAHCMKGIYKAAPYPGFNDGRYRARFMPAETGGVIPLVHALRSVPGVRPRSHDCIIVNGSAAPPAARPAGRGQPSVALHAHLYYPELAPDFVQMLLKTGITADLFISCASEADAREIGYRLNGYKGGRIDIRRVPNAGRDIGPFITEFGAEILAGGYDLAGHLHGKKSKVLGPQHIGDAWRNYLWDNLLAGEGVWDTVSAAFAGDPKLGLLFAEDRNIIGWTRNRAPAEALKRRFGLACELPAIPVFPIGTMFWCRPRAIAPVLESELTWADYPAEPLAYDGTMLHAIERLLPTVCEQSGHAWKTIYLPGSTR